jgi:TFIIH basal transcription factor complex TTD-A subunit
MPRAIRGKNFSSNRALLYIIFSSNRDDSGVLVQCDPSIKSIIVKIDSEDHAFIVEELDDQTLVVKENMMSILKMKLDEVSSRAACQRLDVDTRIQILKETQNNDESSSDD